jgi:tripartite-type tricarboxylate transporter receptor subunit TctC
MHMQALALAAALLMSAPIQAQAQQKYPVKPMRLIVGNTPGSSSDTLSRLIGPKLSELWGQPVVIENRPGAGGLVAAIAVAKATPDGYTAQLVSPSFAIRAALSPDLPYDSMRDFATLGEIGFTNSVIVAAPSLPAKTVKDFIAWVNANPDKVFYGSAGAGTATHIGAERFRMLAGIKARHVGFKGQSEFQLEIVAGRIHFGSTSLTAALGLVKDGKLQALAVAQRTPLLPAVLSFEESIPGWTRDGSQSLLAPAGTPLAIRRQINQDLARVMHQPDTRQRLDAVGFSVMHTTVEQHEKNLRADIAMFGRIVKEAGLRPN